MIVTDVRSTSDTLRGGLHHTATRSLARRGFFFSETESVDYLQLAPGARIDSRGRRGTEEAYVVLTGAGQLVGTDGETSALRPLTLAVCPLNSGAELVAGEQGMELLLVAVAPRHLTETMPTRLPVA